jgi:hypothetical protein
VLPHDPVESMGILRAGTGDDALFVGHASVVRELPAH